MMNSVKRLVRAMPIVLLVVLAGQASATTWQIETVDSAGDVGWLTSLALDGSGQPHISYQDWGNRDLKYARWDGVAWQIETVDSTGDVGGYSSLVLDASGLPHISYRDLTKGDLKYAHWDEVAWQIETVDSVGKVGEFTSLVLDQGGLPHITYYDGTNLDLKYARWDGVAWQIETVDSAGAVGEFTSLALDGAGLPHVAYFDLGNRDLKYARWDGVAWQIEIVASTGSVGWYVSMALDGLDRPHISHHDDDLGTLLYAHWDGVTWRSETVDTGGAGRYTSLGLDGSDRPHISYQDRRRNDLKYARWDGVAWQIETVDSAGKVGEYTSLELDGSGQPHISYRDQTNTDLKYATADVPTPVGPEVAIDQAAAQADPTAVSPVVFTAVFSAPVSGFGDVAGVVVLGGTAGATTAVVTGVRRTGGTTYNVSVSGMTGDGTVTAMIPAGAAVDGSGNGNQASTSTDNSVTYDDATPPMGDLVLTEVATGLTQPVLAVPGSDGTLLIVDQVGQVVTAAGDVVLDITDRVRFEGERGLLGVAVPPDGSDRLIVNYTNRVGTVISEFTGGDRASERVILEIPHTLPNHNGGMMQFGPDGYLWIGMGDGGVAENAQDPASLLGGMLRIDLEGDPYAVPADNPGLEGWAPEKWAMGLRNPWRWSFDGTDLWIADVGQTSWEEINLVDGTDMSGLNFGWPVLEGTHCFSADPCDSTGMTLPLMEYSHDDGSCSVIGGFVYRGAAIPDLVGQFVFGDFCTGFISAVDPTWVITELFPAGTVDGLTGFGYDADGELYVTAPGVVYRIDNA
ncbi:MAG: PQQ-dependent sugar dehydrogenase [Actinomycetota bacterium]|nr:PQQ-dependent sugar dehydrogenase [Actinomycetota bacterium]